VGHRKNLDKYFTVDDAIMEDIRTLVTRGTTMEDLASHVQKKAKLGPDLIKYIARTKITA